MSLNLFGHVSIDNLNVNQNTQVLTNSISWGNPEDYYGVNFSSRSSLNLKVDGLYGNVNLQVLDSNGQELAGSYNRRSLDESISVTLEAGSYYIKVFRVRNATTEYNLKYSTEKIPEPPKSSLPQSTGTWLDMAFYDAQLRAGIHTYGADGVIDRNEVIKILRASEDDGVVNATEFSDLKSLVRNASNLGMPEYVRVLTNKVVNGDAANKRYQGGVLGNLGVLSSSTQMGKLIDKWFLGRDYPTSGYSYREASGSLFQNGASYQDIKQGQINDCFFLVGLAATAIHSPTKIKNMFIDNGDNTFTVRFFNNQVADYITVDKYLPTDAVGNLVYASKGSRYNNPTNELWVALAEKAYAQLNQSGWIYQDDTNSYSGIGKSGYISDAFSHITGNKVLMSNPLSLDSLLNAIDLDKLIGFGSKSSAVAPDIIPSHAYALVNYDSSTQKFTLFNPWGMESSSKPGVLELSWNEILSNFSYWDGAKYST